jgi:hypothetical protein
MKVAEAAWDPLRQLQQPVDGFHDAVDQSGFHVGQDSVEVAFNGASQIAERSQSRALGSCQPPRTPPRRAVLDQINLPTQNVEKSYK